MRNIFAIAERELRTYFVSPIAYVVLTMFVFLSGVFFNFFLSTMTQLATNRAMQSAQSGQLPEPFDMPGWVAGNFLNYISFVMLFLLPMITMALFSEEKKRGTIELLLTAPITDLQVVLGKFFAAAGFYIALLLTTLLEMAVLYMYSTPASGPILTAYLGLLLYGLALLYGLTGTTNLSAVAQKLASVSLDDPTLILAVILVVTGFGFKIAAVPFHMWVPDAYEGAPTSITAFMSAAVKAAAFAGLVRVFVVALAPAAPRWEVLWWVLAALSMLVGNVVAIAQTSLKRMLAYSSISHAGYALIGVVAAVQA